VLNKQQNDAMWNAARESSTLISKGRLIK